MSSLTAATLKFDRFHRLKSFEELNLLFFLSQVVQSFFGPKNSGYRCLVFNFNHILIKIQ